MQPEERVGSVPLPWLQSGRVCICTAALSDCHIDMAAGLGHAGVSNLCEAAEHCLKDWGDHGEVRPWRAQLLARSTPACTHSTCAMHAQGSRKEGPCPPEADPYGHPERMLSSGRQRAPGDFVRQSPWSGVLNLSEVAGRGVPASSPILSRSMAVHCCIMRVTPFACST